MSTEQRQARWRSLSPLRLAERIHRDERGSLSIMGVFSIFFLTVLLGMIFNVGREVDDHLPRGCRAWGSEPAPEE